MFADSQSQMHRYEPSARNNKKAILILQGGGALGAFECGVWKALFPYLRHAGYRLEVIGGSSIGAVNGALIAQHYNELDGGVGELELFWRRELASQPVPLFPLPGECWRRWDGLMSTLLFGHHAIFTPLYAHWNSMGEAARFRAPLYETSALTETLKLRFGEYRGRSPLLAVRAINVEAGAPAIFNSAIETITPQMLAASSAIPMMFRPVEIDGKHYWDGDMWSSSLLPDVLDLLHNDEETPPVIDDYLVVSIDLYQSAADKTPLSTLESSYRLMNIVFGNKANYDERTCRPVNDHLEFIRKAYEISSEMPDSPLKRLVYEEHAKLSKKRRSRLEFMRVDRANLPFEHIAREWDFSPDRIDALIEQGYDNTAEAIAHFQRQKNATTQVLPPFSFQT
jgi:NTE family protein